MLTVTLPYTKADFDQAKQDKYKVAMAATAGTNTANVDIKKVTEKRRRSGSVDVETVIRASDAADAEKLVSNLGTGDTLKTKLNAELVKQSLKESTGVEAPVKVVVGGSYLLSATWVLVFTAPVVAYGLLVEF
jgi:CRISPR/Cas system-associated protein Csm6